MIKRKVSMDTLSKLFEMNYDTPESIDISGLGLCVKSQSNKNEIEYKEIQEFLVKQKVNEYYKLGELKGTANHRVKLNDEYVHLRDHPDAVLIKESMNVVDMSVADNKNYFANGQLNHNTTSGGKALAFHASVRLRLKNMGQIKVKVGGSDKIIGMKVRCQVIKNRMGPPLRSADFEIYFDSGIDNYGSWLSVMKDAKLVTQGGAWYTYVDIETGEEHKFQAKDFKQLMESNSELKEQVYLRMCEATILQYRSNSYDPDTVIIDTAGAGIDD